MLFKHYVKGTINMKYLNCARFPNTVTHSVLYKGRHCLGSDSDLNCNDTINLMTY